MHPVTIIGGFGGCAGKKKSVREVGFWACLLHGFRFEPVMRCEL